MPEFVFLRLSPTEYHRTGTQFYTFPYRQTVETVRFAGSIGLDLAAVFPGKSAVGIRILAILKQGSSQQPHGQRGLAFG